MDGKTTIILASLDAMERQIEQLRNLLGEPKVPVSSLAGIWAGAEITDEDIEDAKRSWTKAADDSDF